MPEQVTDIRSNLNDQIVAAAKIVGRSQYRRSVFRAIYYGKKKIKTVSEIMKFTGLNQIQVLQAALPLHHHQLIEKKNKAYQKDSFYSQHYRQILDNQRALQNLPTKTSPTTNTSVTVRISLPKGVSRPQLITSDDIESFTKISKQKSSSGSVRLLERRIKEAFKKIIGESGSFKDWGGEKSDLYTTRLRVGGRRVPAAIAFKGRGTSGKLVPAKMGKNGDQVNRLFDEPAQLFLIVYCGQIDSSIISQMEAFALAKKAIGGQKVYYGVMDGSDLGRLTAAYPQYFRD